MIHLYWSEGKHTHSTNTTEKGEGRERECVCVRFIGKIVCAYMCVHIGVEGSPLSSTKKNVSILKRLH